MDMENLKKFPKGFFSIVRPEATPNKNKDDEIIPINWSKDVIKGKKKAIVKLVKKSWRYNSSKQIYW